VAEPFRAANCGDGGAPVAGKPADDDRWVGVEAPVVGILVDESVRPAPRLYRPSDCLAGTSPTESGRSGTERDMEGMKLSGAGFRRSLSSFVPKVGATSERLEEPEVETVESDEEDG
jgi:hypothetical protein